MDKNEDLMRGEWVKLVQSHPTLKTMTPYRFIGISPCEYRGGYVRATDGSSVYVFLEHLIRSSPPDISQHNPPSPPDQPKTKRMRLKEDVWIGLETIFRKGTEVDMPKFSAPQPITKVSAPYSFCVGNNQLEPVEESEEKNTGATIGYELLRTITTMGGVTIEKGERGFWNPLQNSATVRKIFFPRLGDDFWINLDDLKRTGEITPPTPSYIAEPVKLVDEFLDSPDVKEHLEKEAKSKKECMDWWNSYNRWRSDELVRTILNDKVITVRIQEQLKRVPDDQRDEVQKAIVAAFPKVIAEPVKEKVIDGGLGINPERTLQARLLKGIMEPTPYRQSKLMLLYLMMQAISEPIDKAEGKE